MKIAIITDTHVGWRNDHPAFNEYFLKFYDDVFFPHVKTHKIKTCFHLGDVFDRRRYINFNTLNEWRRKVFMKMNESFEQVCIIAGNHDTYYKSTNQVNSLEELLPINVYNRFNIFIDQVAEMRFGSLDVLFVPWINPENETWIREHISQSKAKLLCGHLDIKGFNMSGGYVNKDHGFDSIDFVRFQDVYTGHYHEKQQQGNIQYLGTPYQTVSSDYGKKFGFHVLDTETQELEFIENPFCMFERVEYNDEIETPESIIQKDYSHLANKCLKIVVTKKTNVTAYHAFLDLIDSVHPIETSVFDTLVDDAVAGSDSVDITKGTLSVFQDYVDNLGLSDADKVMSVVRQLHVEAINENSGISD